MSPARSAFQVGRFLFCCIAAVLMAHGSWGALSGSAHARQPCVTLTEPVYYHSLPTGWNGNGLITWRRQVAIEGEFAAVATAGPQAQDATMSTGQVHMFRRTPGADGSWVSIGAVVPPDGVNNDRFGAEISMDGGRLVVGAPLHDYPGMLSAGAAYIYRWDGAAWVFEQKLTASDAAAGDQFGLSITIDGDRVLVGAPLDNTPAGVDRGSAYVFRWNGSSWVEEGHLLSAAAGVAGSNLSLWLGLSGDRAALRIDAGNVYVFGWDGGAWVERQEIVNSPFLNDERGVVALSLAMRGDVIAIGNPTWNESRGRVDLFSWNGSAYEADSTLLSPSQLSEEYFGAAAQFDTDGQLFVGSWNRDYLTRFRLEGSGYFEYTGDNDGLWTGLAPLRFSGIDADAERAILFYGDPVTKVTGMVIEPTPPIVGRQPLAQVEVSGQQASFSVIVEWDHLVSLPVTYRWRRDGVELSDGPAPGGGMIIGAATPSLIITSAGEADEGLYDCVLADACNVAPTNAVMLTIEPGAPPFCPGDADGNGMVTFADITSVLATFNSACP